MKLVDKQSFFAQNVAALLLYIHSLNLKCTLGEAYRTPEQASLYAKEGKGIVDSLHCKRLAIDINLFDAQNNYLQDSESYEKLGIFWEKMHPLNRWGGRFSRPDGNHFQMQEGAQ